MVNCNPETVSTDYDTSDRLYFEPLTLEHVLEILRVEQENGTLHGVIVQFGGQTPLKLANALHDAGIPILGTTPDAIDLAEDRERFQAAAAPPRPAASPTNGIARSAAEAQAVAARIGYPLVIRPSYVLGGRAMEIVRDDAQLARYIRDAVQVSGDNPVLLDRYLANAIEVDVDALCDGTRRPRRRRHGAHRGGRRALRRQRLLAAALLAHARDRRRAEAPDRAMALALGVVGLMNVQFAIQDGDIYVLEVNPRASPHRALRRQGHRQRHRRHRRPRHGRRAPVDTSRSAPPTPKASAPTTRCPYADPMTLADPHTPWFSVKEAVMPFNRFPGVDTLLGPEMRSTGEVMGWDRTFPRAFLKAQLGAGTALPDLRHRSSSRSRTPTRTACSSRPPAILHDLGFRLLATARHRPLPRRRTASPPTRVNKVYEGRPHIVDTMKDGGVQLVFNTTEGTQSIADSRAIRALALSGRIPYYTTAAGARAAALAMQDRLEGELEVRSLQTRSRSCQAPHSSTTVAEKKPALYTKVSDMRNEMLCKHRFTLFSPI